MSLAQTTPTIKPTAPSWGDDDTTDDFPVAPLPITRRPKTPTIGSILNVIVDGLETLGLEPVDQSVDETGLTIVLAGHRLRIAFVTV